MSEPVYEIKREWMETYLDVIWDPYPELFFEGQMIEKNEPDGIIPFFEYEEGTVHHIKYRVTGQKPLSSVFRALPMKEWHIRKILGGLIKILENGEEYLLSGDSFLLNGDVVFVDVQTYEPQLIYLPGYNKELGSQMGQLMEFMLNRLDYDDKAAVNLLYDCFAGNQTENGGIRDIKRRLENVIPEVSAEKKVEVAGENVMDKDSERGYRTTLRDIFNRVKGLFVKKEISYQDEDEEKEVPCGETVFLNKKAYVYERREEEKTVFLPEKIMGSTPWLVDIKTSEIIKIQKTPFSMGSLPDYNDYLMNDPRISRLHAAITENEGRFSIMDLNSTNGTYVNDKEVMPGQDEQLFNNDKIRLADREFIYKSGDTC